MYSSSCNGLQIQYSTIIHIKKKKTHFKIHLKLRLHDRLLELYHVIALSHAHLVGKIYPMSFEL